MNTFLNLESDKNSQFEIKIENIEHKLSIKAKNMTVIPNKNYYKSMSLEEIKVNKFFSFCDDIGEVINELTEIKKTKLTEETNQITLYIPINSKKIKEFVIQMKETEKTTEEKFEELYKIINTVREENNKLRIKLEAIEDKYNKEISILKQNNEELKEYFESITNSKILNVNQYKILKNWINPNVIMKFELIYSAKRDGDNRKAFHDRCDNKSPTIIIVKTGKNIIFGGYTEAPWKSEGGPTNDPKSFCFSLSDNKRYLQNKGKNDSIYCDKNYGPWFGTCFFGVGRRKDNFCSDSSANYLNDLGTYGDINYKKYEINGFEQTFICQELEVFEVKCL